MKKILITGVAVAALAGLAPAIAQTAPASAPQAKAAKVTKPITRADAAQKAQQHFTRLDTNKDGFLTKTEAEAAAQATHERVEQRMDKRGDAMFARLDADKNGKVTRTEAESVFASRKAAGKGRNRNAGNEDLLHGSRSPVQQAGMPASRRRLYRG